MAISPTDIRIIFINYDIITFFLSLAFCSEHFISIKHGILATFKGALSAKIVNLCYPQKLSDMIDALIKRVSVTYECYEMYAHREK
jgi:hypothetical protein